MRQFIMIAGLVLLSPLQANNLPNMNLVGQSELNWMFWKIYDIQLLTPDGNYRDNRYPLALGIRYAREIAADDLIETTVDEWQRMGIGWKTGWLDQLKAIWPDVKTDDELLVMVGEDGSSRFYHNGQSTGVIDDSEFARAFLSIWLSEQTREPQMRKQLIGDPDA